MGLYKVGDHLERADGFISSGVEFELRYAALELRFAIEKIVYARLEAWGDELPRDVYETWQPPKAMKLLLSFDEYAGKELQIHIEQSTPEGEVVNSFTLSPDLQFDNKWLGSSYNVLGSLLHMPSLSSKKTPSSMRERIIGIYEEVRRVSNSQLAIKISNITKIECLDCCSNIYVSGLQVDSGAKVYCHNDNCRGEFNINKVDDERFFLERDCLGHFDCRCGNRVSIRMSDIVSQKRCLKCQAVYDVIVSARLNSLPSDDSI